MLFPAKVMARTLVASLVVTVALGVMTKTPVLLAVDAIAPLRAFQKNKLPSEQQIKKSYFNFTYKPLKRKDLSFNLLIPKGWRDIHLTVPANMLQEDTLRMVPLAEQTAPGDDKDSARIQVAYTRMAMEISLYDLLDQYFRENKVDVLVRRQGTYNRREIDEVLTRFSKGSSSFLSRLTFSRHGDRVFVVSGSARESEFIRYAPIFAAAAISFTVHQKASQRYAFPMAVFASAGKPRFKFHHPKSWEIEEHQGLPAGQTAVDMRLVVRDKNKGNVTTYGFIRVGGFSKGTGATPEEILANLKKDFQRISLSYDQCTLKADLMPKQASPLGKLEKWDVMVKGVPGEVAFLVLGHRSGYLGLGLFCMRPEDNLLSWMHVWRVFEIVVNDVTGKHLAVTRIKSLSLPSRGEVERLAAVTMGDFANAAQKRNFQAFHANVSTTLQIQATPARLRQAFRSFAKQKELAALNQLDPVIENEICLDQEGLLKVKGHYPTRPQRTTFSLTYIHERASWKLLGIHVAMKKAP
ncbi:MAG: hypothetical protein JRI80_02225 [Deltaproteobacteria bacterium]|nr:hypothetical protein [Deltaproteobacteria bacterium]